MTDFLHQPLAPLSATPLELAANSAYACSVWLAARNSAHTWWTGILGCALFGWLFYHYQLYADVTLQLFFILTCVLGSWQWLRGAQGQPLPVMRSSPGFVGWRVLAAVVVALGYGWILHRYTQAYAPFIDSLVLTFSVLAQFLMMQRRIEHWYAWLIVNTVAVPLYLSRGLDVTAFFYAVYWCNVVYGVMRWRRVLASPARA
ncbi:nicotinamide riboside transporter PnuC [Chitinibacteraceae bacterium HSL-7]